MKFMKSLSVLFLALSQPSLAKYTDSFIVTLKDRSISVSAPEKRTDTVSVIVENKTLEKVISQIKTEGRVIKRFVLKSKSKEVFQVDMRKVKNLYLVPISPPFQAVELRFSKGQYEIPEKG